MESEAEKAKDEAAAKMMEALTLLRSLVNEGGVPRYTVTPGAAFNALIEEVIDPAIAAARAAGIKP